MAGNTLNARIIHTHDVESNWIKCTSFAPRKGELIVYDPDENYTYTRFKFGDGITTVSELPFAISSVVQEFLSKDGITVFDSGRITSYINTPSSFPVAILDTAILDQTILE